MRDHHDGSAQVALLSRATPSTPSRAMLTVWSGFLLTLPHYYFDSGGLQPADGLLLLLLALLAVSWSLGAGLRLSAAYRPFLAAYAVFLFYVALVNASWSLALTDPAPVIFAAYYVYGFLLLSLFLLLYSTYGDRFLVVTYWSLLAALVPVILVTLGQLTAARPTGTLNNPNQLGYFAVLVPTLMCTLPLKRRTARHDLADVSAWVGAGFLVLASASIGAAAAYGAGAVIVLLLRLRNPRVLLVAPIGILIVLHFGSPWFALDSTAARVDRVQAHSEGGIGPAWLQERGYDRIRHHPEHLVLGAGEGADSRFGPYLQQEGELHSSIGTLVFSYGVIGAVLFALPLVRLVRRGGGLHVLMLAPAFVYGLSHQGLRFRLFWLLLAAVAVAASTSRARQQPATATTADGSPLQQAPS